MCSGLSPAEQYSAQHGMERHRPQRLARRGRDRGRDDVGLLGGEPSLLDRVPGRVAGRVHVFEALHPEEQVGRDEARSAPAGLPGISGTSS